MDSVERHNALNDIAKEVAAMDPFYDVGCGDTECVFCGYLMIASERDHLDGCVFVLAQKVQADG